MEAKTKAASAVRVFVVGAAISPPPIAQGASAPSWLRTLPETTFDGATNGLGTGGFGGSGMIADPDLVYAGPLAPAAEQLRRASIVTDGAAGFGAILCRTPSQPVESPESGDLAPVEI